MIGLRLIADDLTGALDSGCAFANVHVPVLIGLPWKSLPGGPLLAFSTESRDGTALSGEAMVAARMGDMKRDCSSETLWFKKVDSVLRGNPIGETIATLRAGGFEHCIFAPAFPDMGRVTRNGRHYVRAIETGGDHAVGADLTEAFRARGIIAEVRAFDKNGNALPLKDPTAKVSIIDAETQAELSARIDALRRQPAGRLLWAGAGGLAAALAGEVSTVPYPPIRALVSGTRHPVARLQIEHLLHAGLVSPGGENGRNPGHSLLIDPCWHCETAIETHRQLREQIPAIGISATDHSAVFVVGGDTLSTVLQTTDADYLECFGQAATGVPVCRVRGGRWAGVTLLTKSGGFGRDRLLEEIFRK